MGEARELENSKLTPHSGLTARRVVSGLPNRTGKVEGAGWGRRSVRKDRETHTYKVPWGSRQRG